MFNTAMYNDSSCVPQLWEDKEGKKKMNKNNAKALSTLRQKIRKYNRDYETEIASYKEVRLHNSL